jgi:hypothetical protein
VLHVDTPGCGGGVEHLLPVVQYLVCGRFQTIFLGRK